MTCAYNTFFVLIWGSAVLAIPTAVGLFVWLLVTLVPHEHRHAERIVLLSLSVLLLIAWTVGLRRHGHRVLIRSGAFPGWCRGDAYPHDEVELRQAVADLKRRKGRFPAIVGGGWGFFLKRWGPSAPRVFTHHFTGQVPNEPGRWRAGTTIAAVNKHFLENDKTLPSHPTMDYISIGSWVSCANHGNDGDAQTVDAIDLVTILDMGSNTTRRVSYAEARRIFDVDFEKRHCVLDVSFNAVENRLTQKRGILVKDPQSAADWLAPGAQLRLLFLGAARGHGIGLRWERPYDDSPHRNPHCCSRFCQFLQVDVFSVFCGWHEPMSKFSGKVTLHNANRWTPPIYPFMTIGVVLSGIVNFEIFFRLERALDGATLSVLVEEAIAMHKRLGGRSEIRYGRPSANSIVHWDLSLARGHDAPFRLLFERLGVKRVAMHPGKYDVEETAPCARVSVTELTGGPSATSDAALLAPLFLGKLRAGVESAV